MAPRRLLSVFSVAVSLTAFGLTGCGDDGEEEHEETHSHEPTSPSCVELSETCHEADTGSGPAHDCHEIAHHDDEDECAAALVDCQSVCM